MVKEFLSRKGVPYTEKNVAYDRVAAAEMINRSGRNGVPQTLIGDQLVVGFDRPRLEGLLKQYANGAPGASSSGVSLGVSVADAVTHAPGGEAGAYVGKVKPGSLAANAGVQTGDVIVALDGQAVPDADSLITAAQRLRSGRSVSVTVIRDGQRRELRIKD